MTTPREPDLSPNLDILRSMAVLFVLVDHSTKFFGHDRLLGIDINYLGYMGVLWFFVHTSLVLMKSLHREWNASEAANWRRVLSFYLRRAWRIYPLSIAVILVVLIAGIPAQRINVIPGHIGTMKGFVANPLDLVTNFTLTQDLFHSPYVIGVLWSLPVELRMYLVLPGLYLVWRRSRSPLLIFAIWLLAAGYVIAGLPKAGSAIVGFVPCFMAGVTAFAVGETRPRQFIPGWTWIPLLSAIAVTMLVISPDRAATRSLGCLTVGLLVPFVRQVQAKWITKPALEVARYSYGIYLLHVPLLWLTVGHMRTAPAPIQVVVELTALAVAVYFAHWVIEDPGISIGKRQAKRVLGVRETRTAAVGAIAVSPP